MAKKPAGHFEYREVVYDVGHWDLLEKFRKKAIFMMEALEKAHLEAIVHGSIARGDVNEKSDIDVFIKSQTSSFVVETTLEKTGITINKRLIVQATPTYAMKAHIEIDDGTSVSFPLMKMRKVEREFYKFGGEATTDDLRKATRLPGVDKRLMLIEPTEDGHRESAVVGREQQVAKLLGISTETIMERVHTLTRRDKVGRTGVFIKREVSERETFEMALTQLANQNPAVRRRLASLS